MGLHAGHLRRIGGDVAGHTDIDQTQPAAAVQRLQPCCINDRVVGCRAGEHQGTGAQVLIEVREWPALNRQLGKILGQQFSPLHRAIQQHHPSGTLGLKVLKQQPAHAAGPHNGDLFALEGDQLIEATGLTELQLCQLNSGGADGHGPGAEVGLAAHPFAGADGLGEQPVENRSKGFVLLSQAHHLLHLGEDLSLTQDQAVQPGRHPHQVVHGISVVVTEQVGRQFAGPQTGMAAEEIADGGHTQIRMPHQRVDLQAVAGAENRSLDHLIVALQRLEGRLHGLLRDAEPFPDLHRCRAMTEADDGNVHGDVPLNQWMTISSERCSGRRP